MIQFLVVGEEKSNHVVMSNSLKTDNEYKDIVTNIIISTHRMIRKSRAKVNSCRIIKAILMLYGAPEACTENINTFDQYLEWKGQLLYLFLISDHFKY